MDHESRTMEDQRVVDVIDLTDTDDIEEIILDGVQGRLHGGDVQHRPPRRTPHPNAEIIDLESDDRNQPPPPASLRRQHAIEISEPEVQFVQERRRPREELPPLTGLHLPTPTSSSSQTTYWGFPPFQQIRDMVPNLLSSRSHQHGPSQPARNPNGTEYGIRIGRHTQRHPSGLQPYSNVIFDFRTTGFDLGYMREAQAPPRSSPVLEPLKPVREGFTRTPVEGDALICPSCHDELCTGDTDEKKQVWVIKACGHVYCGRCAKLSQQPAPKSGKSKGKQTAIPDGVNPPRPKCVVPDCDKNTRGKHSMIQLFL